VLQQRGAFGMARAVVELQQRHVAARRDLEVVAAAIGQRVGREVDLVRLEGDAGLAQRDVDGQRAGAGGEIELHGKVLLRCRGGESRIAPLHLK